MRRTLRPLALLALLAASAAAQTATPTRTNTPTPTPTSSGKITNRLLENMTPGTTKCRPVNSGLGSPQDCDPNDMWAILGGHPTPITIPDTPTPGAGGSGVFAGPGGSSGQIALWSTPDPNTLTGDSGLTYPATGDLRVANVGNGGTRIGQLTLAGSTDATTGLGVAGKIEFSNDPNDDTSNEIAWILATRGTGGSTAGDLQFYAAPAGAGIAQRLVIYGDGATKVVGPLQIADGTTAAGNLFVDCDGAGTGCWATPVPTATPLPTATPGAGGRADAVDTTGLTAGEIAVATDPNTIVSYSSLKRDLSSGRVTVTSAQSTSAGSLNVLAADPNEGASLYLQGAGPATTPIPWSVVASTRGGGALALRRGAGAGAGDASDDQWRLDPNGATYLRQTTSVPTPTTGYTALYAQGSSLYYLPAGGSATALGGNAALSVTTATGETTARLKAVLHLHFDGSNASTTFTDEAGNTITANGDAQLSTTSPQFGTAAGLFDGTGDYLTVPNTRALELRSEDFTFETWMKSTGTNSFATIITRPSTSGFASPGWSLLYNTGSANGRLALYVADFSATGALVTASSGDVHDGSWHHVAVTRQEATWTIWLDGSSVGTATFGGTVVQGARLIYIGHDPNNGGRTYNGRFDEMRLSIGTALYTTSFTPAAAAFSAPIAGKLMYWDAANSAIYATN